jgi:pimeloyl-ACP methyl ester carboxylesterase
MTRRVKAPLSMLLAVTLTMLAAASAATQPGRASATPAGSKVIKLPVAFEVRNTNGSILPCPSDEATYQVKGHLIGPASTVGPNASEGRRSVALYLHGSASGEFLWNFSAIPRYDYAASMARAGHASVVIDRLGYGSSGRPDGNQTCLGSAADVAHQVIGKLRSGDYVVEDGESPRFDRVTLVGHSVGALIANLEALSFNDIDGLVGISYTPQVTQQAFQHFYTNRTVCEAGGEPSGPAGPDGYAYFGQTDAEFRANVFHSAEPAVMNLAAALRGRDPCGDTASIIGALVRDVKSRSRVKVPVLIVCGREDTMTPDFACPYLKRRYVGSKDVSLVFVPNAGHALPLERTAPILRRRVSAWLSAHEL